MMQNSVIPDFVWEKIFNDIFNIYADQPHASEVLQEYKTVIMAFTTGHNYTFFSIGRAYQLKLESILQQSLKQ